ncbi:hypothetical protein [Xanthomonas bundabergensis]|uniref:hypothetical protein n=1 Tax=Xanthomonas bundabergensis TaxID=3160842 RepID=UPI0035154F63
MTSATLRRCRTAAVIAFALMAVGDVWAQQPGPGVAPMAPPREAARPRDYTGSSLSDAVRRVQRSTGGQILGAERVPFDGRDINRVKYMDGRGRVRYMDDPQPGRAAPPRVPRPSDAQEPPRGDNP